MWPWKHFPHSNIIKEASNCDRHLELQTSSLMTLSITIIDPWRFYIWKNFPWRGELLAVSWLQNHDVKLEATTLFFADDSLDEISSSSCRCQLTGSRLWHHKESQWRFRILQSSTSITEIRSSREDLRINSELIQSGRQTKILVT